MVWYGWLANKLNKQAQQTTANCQAQLLLLLLLLLWLQ